MAHIKSNILDYCSSFEHSAYYDSNGFQYGLNHREKYAEYELIAAANTINTLSCSPSLLADVDYFMANTPDWLFGYLSYELKNEIHSIVSSNCSKTSFKSYSFFQPETIFTIKGNTLAVHSTLDSNAIN